MKATAAHPAAGRYDNGLKHALIALSFFRSRNQRKPRFKHASKTSNIRQTVNRRPEAVRSARAHIALARSLGWRGSVRAAIGAHSNEP